MRTGGYTGPDRRRPITAVDSSPYVARTVFAGLAVVTLWCLLVALAADGPVTARLALIGLSRAVASGLILAGAALRFAAWRITGTARAAWSSIALGVAGLALPVVGLIGRLAPAGPGMADTTAIARGLVDMALISFGVAALISPDVVSRLRPFRIAAPFMAGCLMIAAVVVIRGPAEESTPALAITAELLRWALAALWLLLAAAYVMMGRRRGRRGESLFGLALLVPAAGSLARAVLGPRPYQQMLIPAAGQLFAACVIAGVAALALWRLQTGRGTRLLAVAGELHGARTDLVHLERDQARRLHDARNAILAVSGAVQLLARPGTGGADPDRLQHLVAAELDRLAGLLDPAFRSASRGFRLSEVLEPLVLAHRLAGGTVTADLGDCVAVGRPDATATAVANLLTNARVHAPGAQVWISARAVGDSVEIRVSDDGPGIPAAERALVMQPGARGSTAGGEGSGIGLAAAAQAMCEQGGTLRLSESPGGGTTVLLTLRRDRRQPAATRLGASTVVPIPAQRRHPIGESAQHADDSPRRHPARVDRGAEPLRLKAAP